MPTIWAIMHVRVPSMGANCSHHERAAVLADPLTSSKISGWLWHWHKQNSR